MNVHFSSETDDWYTPQFLFELLDNVYEFKTDVCASNENAKCDKYFTREDNGLKMEWAGSCWMNPPYGREIGTWVGKAHYESVTNGSTVVCLIPSRTDTKWWHDFAMKGRIFFIRGRLKFGGSKTNAPFPSAVVVFDKKNKPNELKFGIASMRLRKLRHEEETYDQMKMFRQDD